MTTAKRQYGPTSVGSERYERMMRVLAADPELLALVAHLVGVISDRVRLRR
jgi:hypothetical protein